MYKLTRPDMDPRSPANQCCLPTRDYSRLFSSTLRRNSRVLPFSACNHYQTDVSNYHRRSLGFASYHQCHLPGCDGH